LPGCNTEQKGVLAEQLRSLTQLRDKGRTRRFCLEIDIKSAGRRHEESDGDDAVLQGTNHGLLRGLLGFGATAAIMA